MNENVTNPIYGAPKTDGASRSHSINRRTFLKIAGATSILVATGAVAYDGLPEDISRVYGSLIASRGSGGYAAAGEDDKKYTPLSDPLANPTEEDMLSKTVRGATYDQNGNLMLAGFELGRDPQTPAEFAAAVLDTHNDDAVNRYLELWTPEMRAKMDIEQTKRDLKVHPTMTSMSVDRVWMPEVIGSDDRYYDVAGKISLEDGRTMKYDLSLLKEQGSIEIDGIDALYFK